MDQFDFIVSDGQDESGNPVFIHSKGIQEAVKKEYFRFKKVFIKQSNKLKTQHASGTSGFWLDSYYDETHRLLIGSIYVSQRGVRGHTFYYGLLFPSSFFQIPGRKNIIEKITKVFNSNDISRVIANKPDKILIPLDEKPDQNLKNISNSCYFTKELNGGFEIKKIRIEENHNQQIDTDKIERKNLKINNGGKKFLIKRYIACLAVPILALIAGLSLYQIINSGKEVSLKKQEVTKQSTKVETKTKKTETQPSNIKTVKKTEIIKSKGIRTTKQAVKKQPTSTKNSQQVVKTKPTKEVPVKKAISNQANPPLQADKKVPKLLNSTRPDKQGLKNQSTDNSSANQTHTALPIEIYGIDENIPIFCNLDGIKFRGKLNKKLLDKLCKEDKKKIITKAKKDKIKLLFIPGAQEYSNCEGYRELEIYGYKNFADICKDIKEKNLQGKKENILGVNITKKYLINQSKDEPIVSVDKNVISKNPPNKSVDKDETKVPSLEINKDSPKENSINIPNKKNKTQ
jgi:hypothetical protein